ncbi:MAG: phospho-sugar mutase [Oscillospiraceae bacterium]|nr:phospho-sugar mutase [Oscillospiraceae bacterium]
MDNLDLNTFAPSSYSQWLSSPALSDAERLELESIIDDEREIESRFFALPEFGTAGLRSVMGVGLTRMNIHVVRWTTQAFAEIITERNAAPTVVICHDCRINSREFSIEAARVLAGNGIRVLLFDDMRPTPELSFAVREYGAAAGINITASHNTSEYNGYKVYGPSGAQLNTADASKVARRMAELDVFASPKIADYDDAVSRGLIVALGGETDEKFLARVLELSSGDRSAAENLSIVYTPFNGAGRVLVPEALRRAGFASLHCVAEQMIPDGRFPTVRSPNPENPESFALAETLAKDIGADIIIGTDPDADRIAVVARHNGVYTHISGHATGALLLDYRLQTLKNAGALPTNAVALKTIVTTDLARLVAEYHGARSEDTFTGFKFIAERRDALESSGEGAVVFAYEESYGYMAGDFTRDKDAVSAALLLAECAAHCKSRGMTLIDALIALYERHGYHAEETVNLVMPGVDGITKMRQLMKILRDEPPADIAGTPVISHSDYRKGITYGADGETALPIRGSDVLQFDLADGTRILVRPSGTEPKIKVYVLAKGADMRDATSRAIACADWAEALPKKEL